jgi:hypothetical protein
VVTPITAVGKLYTSECRPSGGPFRYDRARCPFGHCRVARSERRILILFVTSGHGAQADMAYDVRSRLFLAGFGISCQIMAYGLERRKTAESGRLVSLRESGWIAL